MISQLHLLDADDGHVVDAARRALGRNVVVDPPGAQDHASDLGRAHVHTSVSDLARSRAKVDGLLPQTTRVNLGMISQRE
jgi:hypothetical protein